MRHLFDSPLGASPFNRGAPKNVAPLMAAALPSIITAGSNLIGGAINNIVNRSNMDYQVEQAKQLAKYQWDNFQSYPAQVKSMLKAGLNPAAMLGQGGSGTSASPSINMPTAAPVDLGLSTSLSEIGNFVKSMADAKKAGADTDKVLAETDAIKLQYDLQNEFGQKSWILDLAQKYQNVLLAKKTNDIKEQEKAINEYKKASEKALSESNGLQRDMLEKRLLNIDTEIRLSNKLSEEKINTEKSQQGALSASARASDASADLQISQKKYQDIVNEIKESGKTFELENLIRKWQAENKVSDASAEQAYTMLERYKQLNKNDKNAAAKYLNYMFWFIKEQMPNLPIVPLLKFGK